MEPGNNGPFEMRTDPNFQWNPGVVFAYLKFGVRNKPFTSYLCFRFLNIKADLRIHASIEENINSVESLNDYYPVAQLLGPSFNKNIEMYKHMVKWGCNCTNHVPVLWNLKFYKDSGQKVPPQAKLVIARKLSTKWKLFFNESMQIITNFCYRSQHSDHVWSPIRMTKVYSRWQKPWHLKNVTNERWKPTVLWVYMCIIISISCTW